MWGIGKKKCKIGFLLILWCSLIFEGTAQNWSISGRNAVAIVDGVKIIVKTTSPSFERKAMNINGRNFWSPSSVAGMTCLSTTFNWNNSITFEFRDSITNQFINVKNPVIHVDHVGGIQHKMLFYPFFRSTSYSSLLTLNNGLSWQKISGTSDFILNNGNGVDDSSAGNVVTGVPLSTDIPSADDWNYAASGSLRINGTISRFTLTVPHFRGPKAPRGDRMKFAFTSLDANSTIVIDDSFITDFEKKLEGANINVLLNDIDNEGHVQSVVRKRVNTFQGGVAILSSLGGLIYLPPNGFSGTDFFVYDVCDSEGACDQGRVEIRVNRFFPPDYFPTLFSGKIIVFGEKGNIDFLIAVAENNGKDSRRNFSVEVMVPHSQSFAFTFDSDLLDINGVPVDNSDWAYSFDSGLHKFEYIANGGVFLGGGLSRIGVKAVFNSPINSSRKVPLKVTIKSDSGGQINRDNDNDQDMIEYKN